MAVLMISPSASRSNNAAAGNRWQRLSSSRLAPNRSMNTIATVTLTLRAASCFRLLSALQEALSQQAIFMEKSFHKSLYGLG